MKRNFAVVLFAGCFLAAGAAAMGAVVQLPTFSQFGVSTTVLAPDSGGVNLGGVNGSASGGGEFGASLSPWRSSAFGSQCDASNMHLVATIHDFEAMDRALLARAGGLGRTSSTPVRENPLAGAGKDSAPVPPGEIRAERRRQDEARRAEWEEWLAQGDRAAKAGKPGAARVYYKMVIRRANDELQKEAKARLARLDKSRAESKEAKRTPSTDRPTRQ